MIPYNAVVKNIVIAIRGKADKKDLVRISAQPIAKSGDIWLSGGNPLSSYEPHGPSMSVCTRLGTGRYNLATYENTFKMDYSINVISEWDSFVDGANLKPILTVKIVQHEKRYDADGVKHESLTNFVKIRVSSSSSSDAALLDCAIAALDAIKVSFGSHVEVEVLDSLARQD